MPRTYHIDIDSYIGYPISKGYVKNKLQPMKGKPCTVRINSYGGDVQTALDIRQQFIDHGQVTAYIIGMTASAATILAMGARKVAWRRAQKWFQKKRAPPRLSTYAFAVRWQWPWW